MASHDWQQLAPRPPGRPIRGGEDVPGGASVAPREDSSGGAGDASVQGCSALERMGNREDGMGGLRSGGWAVLLTLVLLAPTAAHAETDVKVRGLLDLGLVSSTDSRRFNQLTFGDSNFDPYRLRLFLDAQLSPALEVHVQSLFAEALGVMRADGAYALWTPWPNRDLSFEAGKIPWPIGTYAPRTYSDRNWLMGTPLMYQYHTALVWNIAQLNADDVVAQAGQGQLRPDAGKYYLPVIDERWWDTGAVALGSSRPFEFSFGVVQGSPSWPAPGNDNTPGQTVLGRLGLVPAAGIRLGVSGADGTWMPAWYSVLLPAGGSVRDYRETTLMADAEFAEGPFELRGEAVHRRWETSTAGDLDVDAGYVEARWSLSNGVWLAVRGEAMQFSDVTTAALVTRPWDDDVQRCEGVIGYRLTRDVRLKFGGQRTVRQPFGSSRITNDFLTAGLSLRF